MHDLEGLSPSFDFVKMVGLLPLRSSSTQRSRVPYLCSYMLMYLTLVLIFKLILVFSSHLRKMSQAEMVGNSTLVC